MTDLTKAASRPLGVASAICGHRIDEHTYFSKLVVLTAEASALKTQNGAWCYLDALMLLIRIAGNLIVHIPRGTPDGFEEKLTAIVKAMCFRPGVTILLGTLDSRQLQKAAAVLNIGPCTRLEPPWISIGAAGWVARACDKAYPDDDFSSPNPIACLLAASVGVSEVFRRLVEIPIERAPPLGKFEASLFNITSTPSGRGPTLPDQVHVPHALLAGAGAIGHGVTLLLSQLGATGSLHIIDRQAYGDENLGTCIVAGKENWVGVDKAPKLAEWLRRNSAMDANGERAPIEEVIGSLKPKPTLVLGALDDVKARHVLQLLWPDIMIDGGIGTIGATVVQHRCDDRGLACLRCSFKQASVDLNSVQRELTGLSNEVLKDPDRPLTTEDVDSAVPEKREWLASLVRQRKTVCSVISEAALREFGVDAERGFRPSVPFVATAAAALMIAEMVKAVIFSEAYKHTTTIQNLLLGREGIEAFDSTADAECLCVRHRSIINRLRLKSSKAQAV